MFQPDHEFGKCDWCRTLFPRLQAIPNLTHDSLHSVTVKLVTFHEMQSTPIQFFKGMAMLFGITHAARSGDCLRYPDCTFIKVGCNQLSLEITDKIGCRPAVSPTSPID